MLFIIRPIVSGRALVRFFDAQRPWATLRSKSRPVAFRRFELLTGLQASTFVVVVVVVVVKTRVVLCPFPERLVRTK